jgi:hypothetical protein
MLSIGSRCGVESCVKYTGFQAGDTEGVLKGMTTAGAAFKGRDTVNVVP